MRREGKFQKGGEGKEKYGRDEVKMRRERKGKRNMGGMS